MNKPHGHIKESHVSSIAIARFDITAFVGKEIIPFAVMHRRFQSLKNISEMTGLVVEAIDNVDKRDAVRVHGNYNHNPNLHIDSVWVAAASNKYRKALQERGFSANLISQKFPSDLHADHVLNRASLIDMMKKGHEPWLLLFEVPGSANTNYGNLVERHLPAFSPDAGQAHLSPIQLFKLLCTDWPKSKENFEESLRQITAQGVNEEWVAQIREQLHGLFLPA